MSRLIFSLLIPFSIVNSLSGQVASDYFPLHLGEHWTWNEFPVGGSDWAPRTVTWEIDGPDLIFGEEYLSVERREIANDSSFNNVRVVHWLREDSQGNINIGAFGNIAILDSVTVLGAPAPFFPNDYLVLGYSLEFEFNGLAFRNSVESISETVVVPLGTFTDCIKISYTQTDSLGVIVRLENEYYAQGIGRVLSELMIPEEDANQGVLVDYSVRSVSVEDTSGGSTPNKFKLSQNYPNPFNPSTVISYSLAESQQVRLTVFDLLGREVAQLVNRFQLVGQHQITFNAVDLPSGIYVYHLESEAAVETRKMILVR